MDHGGNCSQALGGVRVHGPAFQNIEERSTVGRARISRPEDTVRTTASIEAGVKNLNVEIRQLCGRAAMSGLGTVQARLQLAGTPLARESWTASS